MHGVVFVFVLLYLCLLACMVGGLVEVTKLAKIYVNVFKVQRRDASNRLSFRRDFG